MAASDTFSTYVDGLVTAQTTSMVYEMDRRSHQGPVYYSYHMMHNTEQIFEELNQYSERNTKNTVTAQTK